VDSTGRKNGTLIGTASGGATAKVGDAACDFDGDSDYIQVNLADTGDKNMTICMWWNPDTLSTYHYLATQNECHGANGDFCMRVGSNDNYYIEHHVTITAGDLAINVALAATDWNIGKYQAMCTVLNQTGTALSLRAYINATLAGTDTSAGDKANWVVEDIAAEVDTNGRFSNSQLDEICIWNSSLTSTEIAEYYTGVRCDGVVVAAVINNTKPNITISYPSDRSYINNNSKYPFKINGTTAVQKNSTHGNQTSAIIHFTFDTTNPVLVTNIDNNGSLANPHANFTFEINATDNYQIWSFNVTTPEGFEFIKTEANTSKYIYNGSINVSDYGIGMHNLTAWTCDSHTGKYIKDYTTTKDIANLKLIYDTGDNNIGIKLKDATTTLNDFDTFKKIDRYVFWFDFDGVEDGTLHTYTFKIDADDLKYVSGSSYDGHFISQNNWVDFEFGDDNAIYTVKETQPNKYEVEIKTTKTYLEFESVGDLNCISRTWNYYIFNYTASYSATVLETSTDFIVLEMTFEDMSIVGNGTLNYMGVSYNTTNISSTNQLNLTINFTIPSIPQSSLNVSFLWNLNLNGSLLQTINFTQEISRIQIARCGALTNTNTLNISVYDEDNPTTKLNSEIDVTFNVWTNDSTNLVNFTFELNGSDTYDLCIYPNTSINVNSEMVYNVSGGFTQRWWLRSARLTQNISLLSLYDFDYTTGIDELRGTLRDINFDYFNGIYTEMQRFYTGENVWRTVQKDRSDDYGQILFNIIEGTQDYRFKFFDDTTNIDNTGVVKFLCDTNNICEVTFMVERIVTVTEPELLIYAGYDNVTEIFQLNFSDSTGLTSSVRLRMTKETGVSSTAICDTTISASSGTINCDTTGYNGYLKAQIYKSSSDELPFKIINIHKLVSKLFQQAGIGKLEAGLWTTGIVSTLVGLGAMIHPVMALIIYIFSLFAVFSLGLLNFATITFISALGAMAVIIAIIIRRER